MPTFVAEFTGTITMICDDMGGVLDLINDQICDKTNVNLESVIITKQ